MKELGELRSSLTEIDNQLLELFARRMALVDQAAAYKIETGSPVRVPVREGVVMARARSAMPAGLEQYGASLFRTMLRLSRERQYERVVEGDDTWQLGQELNEARQRKNVWEVLAVVRGEAEKICQKILPKARLVPAEDAASACGRVQSGAADAAVLPHCQALRLAAGQNLFIQACLAADSPFAVVGRELTITPGASQVSLGFEPGLETEALSLLVDVFADLDLRLTELHNGDTCFVEFTAAPGQPTALRALYQLEQEISRLRLLGWYPVLQLD